LSKANQEFLSGFCYWNLPLSCSLKDGDVLTPKGARIVDDAQQIAFSGQTASILFSNDSSYEDPLSKLTRLAAIYCYIRSTR
ncbi:hypothetical protein MKW98_021490, partial [Papaver atlanticum]